MVDVIANLEEQVEEIQGMISAIEYGGNTGTRESAPDALRRLEEELAQAKTALRRAKMLHVTREFTSKPVKVRALQWTGDNLLDMFSMCGRIKQDLPFGQIGVFSPGESGYRPCDKGGWVIEHADGTLRTMTGDEFDAAFERP